MTFTVPFSPDAPARAIRLEVRKDGNKFIGDLVWSNGDRWPGWQTFSTLKALKKNAEFTFHGSIVRV